MKKYKCPYCKGNLFVGTFYTQEFQQDINNDGSISKVVRKIKSYDSESLGMYVGCRNCNLYAIEENINNIYEDKNYTFIFNSTGQLINIVKK